MKSKKLIVFLLLVIAVPGFSQSHWGVTAGINFSRTRLNDAYRYYNPVNPGDPILSADKGKNTITLRPMIGGFYYSEISKHVGIQVDLAYQGLGHGDIKDAGVYGNNSARNMSYLAIPVSFIYKPANRLSLSMGLYAGYLLGITNGSQSISRGAFNPVDFGASTGVEYRILKGISCGLKYYFGLLNTERLATTSQNRAVQFYGAYRFIKKN